MVIRVYQMVLIGFVVAGCSKSAVPKDTAAPQERSATPQLRLVRTVTLHETDSSFIGSPSALWLGAHGAFFIADRFHKTVFRIDSAGAITASFGRPGPGPGELESPLQLIGLGDSALGVVDETKRAIEIFSLSDGTFKRARRYDGSVMSVAVDGPRVWMGGIGPRYGRGVKQWDLASDSITYLVPLPGPYTRNGGLANFFYNVGVVPKGDKLVVGYSADRAILVTNRDGALVDSFAVPAIHRRGEPVDLEKRVDPKADMEFGQIVALTSVLFQIGLQADGALVFVHFDYGFTPPRTITTKAFISVVSSDLSRACVDAELPQEDPAVIPIAFQGDTLFTALQRVGQNQRAETSLMGYLVDTSNCDWVPVSHGKLH